MTSGNTNLRYHRRGYKITISPWSTVDDERPSICEIHVTLRPETRPAVHQLAVDIQTFCDVVKKNRQTISYNVIRHFLISNLFTWRWQYPESIGRKPRRGWLLIPEPKVATPSDEWFLLLPPTPNSRCLRQ